MGNPKKPDDRRPKKLSKGGTAVQQAVGLQAANIAQKSMLDALVARLVLITKILKGGNLTTHAMGLDGKFSLLAAEGDLDAYHAQEALNEINALTTMDRHQIEELTSRPGFVYPDPVVQQIIDEAVEAITRHMLVGTGHE